MGDHEGLEGLEGLRTQILEAVGITEDSTDCKESVSQLNRVLAEHTLRGCHVAAGDDKDCERVLRYVYDLSCNEKQRGKVFYAVSYVVSTMIRAYDIPRKCRSSLYNQVYWTLCATHPLSQRTI